MALSAEEIARLVTIVLNQAPAHGLVEALHRRGRGDATSVVRLVRCLVHGDGDVVQALERLASEPWGESAGAHRVFRRDGDYWTIAYGGRLVRCRHAKGLTYLAALLRHPGEWIAAATVRDRVARGKNDVTEEQARLSVTKAIRGSLARLAQIHPDLGRHLHATVRTGGRCAYMPDPEHLIRWTT